MIENKHRRARSFWTGFGVGTLFFVVVLILLWFVGVVDVFPQSTDDAQVNESNQVANNEVLENSVFDNAIFDNDLANEDEDTDNNLDNDTNVTNDTSDTDNKSSVSSGGVTLTTARDVDESANPVGATELFDEDDDRIYVIVEFDDPAELGGSPTVTVEWSKEGSALSDFDYDLPKGQSRIYFYQNNAGVGDYEVVILVDGDEVASTAFVVE